ncbi:hypothetical protein MKZ02_23955 [Pseudobacillus sp. FSL P4-0506]|uniref:hypothetical protein n=1 Tax=Pseudobacillus sp. FSL P4-0506 TaxID=2921576 RepID=UPI0030F8E51D
MEIPIPLAIIIGLVFLFIQYAIIELAVKRGIDASETKDLLKELKDNVKDNKKKKE